MIYCDTSLLVSALANEPRGAPLRYWLEQQSDDLAISAWVRTEFAAAIGRKRRMAALSEHQAAEVLRHWQVAQQSFVELPFESALFQRAADLALDPAIDLRGGDALHLAIAVYAGSALATLDSGLHRACLAVGVLAIDPLA